jgi:poly(A) polymerase
MTQVKKDNFLPPFAFPGGICYLWQMMNQITPVIIPRPQHTISRSQLSPNAVQALYRLKRHGFTAYLVGGCVLDLLLGREPKDFDLVTDATPGQVKRIFRNCRLVGRRFRLAHLHFSDEIVEVATFRAAEPGEPVEAELLAAPAATPAAVAGRVSPAPRHLKSEEGVVLRDNVFGTPEEDAMRRDFTVNALCYDIGDFSIIDYAGGMEDLKRGVIRTIGNPAARFTEDPVRMLRAIRFAAMLGFTIENATWGALVGQSATITRSSPPRLYEEILKLLLCGEGKQGYHLLRRSGLMAALLPGFNDWLGQESDGFPHARMGQSLDWIDRRIGEGKKVSPQLLLALIFGEYLKEKGESNTRAGTPLQQSLDMAIAGLLGELAPTLFIPNRVGAQLRDILTYQRRFHKTPGKQPLSFISRPSFAEALECFSFTCSATGEGTDILRFWERFVLENRPGPDVEAAGQQEAPISLTQAKHGRRRRRPKKAHRTQSP